MQGDKSLIDFRTEIWLFWDPTLTGDSSNHGDYRRSLRIQRRQSTSCAAGEIVVSKWANLANVIPRTSRLAFFKTSGGTVDVGALSSGRYILPASVSPPVEDKALFDAAFASGLIRRTSSGLVLVAPRDLPTWLATPDDAKLKADWGTDPLNREQTKLLHRLYEDEREHKRLAFAEYIATRYGLLISAGSALDLLREV